MISTITSDLIGAVIVLGVIIVLHELGHFLVAKFFGIRVETFSVGFGPRLAGFRYGETDYRISAFPLGGYVKMSGENPTDNLTGDPREFLSKPKWQRFLVAAAGPAMNIVLAVVLLTGVYMYGSEIPAYWNEPAVVGIVGQNSVAAKIGMEPGDRIIALDGKSDPDWQEVENKIITNPGTPLAIKLNRSGRTIETTLTPERQTQDGPAGPAEVGEAGFCPLIPVVVKRVWKGYPGEAAGLQPADEIKAVNGVPLASACRPIQAVIKDIAGDAFPITILRQGQTQEVQVKTKLDEEGQKRIGMDIPYPMVQVKHGLGDALQQSIATNKEQATMMFQVIGKLFRRQASLNQLAGPIGIVRVSGQAFEYGAGALIRLMAFISLNLGVLNTLPIPILDGGVMLLILVESIIRRDLSLQVKERIVQVGFVFLLVLTVLVLYNDVMKLGQHAP